MRVKIIQPGWDKYNGPLYGIPFEDGVSQGELRRDQALQLGAMMPVVEIDENGDELGPVSPSHEMVVTASIAAEVVEPLKTDAQVSAEKAQLVGETSDFAAQMDELAASAKLYTEAELQAIADTKGIAGLRVIGAPLGVKNTAIRGLIREIMAAQNGQ
jgi:hypothetical protein